MNLEQLARALHSLDSQAAETVEKAVKRIAELEEALQAYGIHDIGCRYGEVSPDAVCTCGLEARINGNA